MQDGLFSLTAKGVGAALSSSIWISLSASLPEYLPVVAVSGLCGGIARWIADRSGVLDGIGTMISGMLVGIFFWPVGQPMTEGIVGKLDMEPVAAMMFGGFLTGLLGITFIGGILDVFRARKRRLMEVEHAED